MTKRIVPRAPFFSPDVSRIRNGEIGALGSGEDPGWGTSGQERAGIRRRFLGDLEEEIVRNARIGVRRVMRNARSCP
jgi:hypothetical protein